jgi:YggT family protein
VALVLVQVLATLILWSLRQYPWVFTPAQFFLVALASLLSTVLMFYIFALLLYVLLSWVAPGTYSPASTLVSSLCEPLLAPVKRVIPPLGGVDFSAAFVIIALYALNIAVREYLLLPGY